MGIQDVWGCVRIGEAKSDLLVGIRGYLIATYANVGNAACGRMGNLTDALVRNAGLFAALAPSVVLGNAAPPAKPGSTADATS